MEPRLAVLVCAPDGTDHVFSAVELVRRSTVDDVEIVVLCGDAVRTELVPRLQAIWSAGRVRCIASAGDSVSSVRNSGLRAASAEWVMFLEAGDTIDPAYIERALEAAGNSELDVVTAWARIPGSAALRGLTKPQLTIEALLADHNSLPGPTVFRRAKAAALGGFDTALESWEWNDFWIRALAEGWRGHVIDQALIGHDPSRQSAYRKRLRADPEGARLRAYFEKHLSRLRHHVERALCDREIDMRTLAARYHGLVRRRDGLIEQRARLTAATAETIQRLQALDGDGFEWGDLRRVLPVSADWGYERGVPIDRYYIERFLEAHAQDVRGRVLEIQEPDYTKRFGRGRVTQSDVIDVAIDNARANLTGDLRQLDGIPSNTYDCFILTQTIHVINDMRSVLRQAVRILKPGGALLVTLPCASRVCLEYGSDGDFWRVTEAGARELFREFFASGDMEIQTVGNVLANTAFAAGLACHELSAEEFEVYDPFNPSLVGIRAVKPGAPEIVRSARVPNAGAVLLYHRVADAQHDLHEMCLHPETFRSQMQLLKREYQPVPLAQLAMAAREGWMPERAVAVTFDDGYLDNLQVASPILCQLGIPATFFINSDPLNGHPTFWWDTLESIFLGNTAIPAQLDIEVGGARLRLPTGTSEQRLHAHWQLYHPVRQSIPEERARVIQALSAWAHWSPAGAPRGLNRGELQELASHPGHSIGGHGVKHLSYSSHSRHIVRADVTENRLLLEAVIGRIVTSFAYPFGDHDDQAVEVVDEAGYRAAVTCEADVVRPGCDPLRLPRLAIGPRDQTEFAERLRAWFEPERREVRG